jgi:hypothetical protein
MIGGVGTEINKGGCALLGMGAILHSWPTKAFLERQSRVRVGVQGRERPCKCHRGQLVLVEVVGFWMMEESSQQGLLTGGYRVRERGY